MFTTQKDRERESDEDKSPRYISGKRVSISAIKVELVLVEIKLGLTFVGVKLGVANN